MKSFIILVSIFLTGCSSTYDYSLIKAINVKLDSSKSVNITTPANGNLGKIVYKSSGNEIAKALKSSFEKYAQKVSVDEHGDYEVRSEILQWEDRATEWSGKRDIIKVLISVYEKGLLISRVIIYGQSKPITLGGERPEDLLEKPIYSHIESLY